MNGASTGGGGARMGGGPATMGGSRTSFSSGGIESRGASSPFSSNFKAGMAKAETPMVSLKHNPKVAHSESLAFKEKIARPMIDMSQKARIFSNESKPLSKTVQSETRIQKSPESFNRKIAESLIKPEVGSKTAETKQKDVRLAYARQELRKMVTTPLSERHAAMEKQIERVRMLKIESARKNSGHEKMAEAYKTYITKPTTETKPITKIEAPAKKINHVDVKKIVRQRVDEIMKKMSTRVELQRKNKTLTKTETKLSPMSTEKFDRIMQEKVQSKVAAQTKTYEQAATAVKPVTRTETAVRADSATQTKTQSEVKTQAQVDTQLKSKTKTHVESNSETLEQLTTEVVKKEDIENQVATEIKTNDNANEEKERSGTEDIKHAYFNVDEETNEKRKNTIEKTYLKLKDKLKKAGINRKPTGLEVAADAYKSIVEMKSKSILNTQDGSAVMFLGHVAKQDEIIDLREIKRVGQEAAQNTATDLNITPKKVVGNKEAYGVHQRLIFPARMDGKPVVVKLQNNLVEA